MISIRPAILSMMLIGMFSVSLTAQTSTPAIAPTRVSAAEQEKRLSKRVNPKYPKEAFDAKLTGTIKLEIVIDTEGKVRSVRVLGKGEELLVKAATDAVKQWVYKPYKVNGKAVEVVTIVTVNFKVGEQ